MTQELPVTPISDQINDKLTPVAPTQPIVSSQNFCQVCGTAVTPIENFCPHCGAKLHKFDETLGFGRKLYIYTIALVGPPFGLVWFLKYFRSENADLKKVAYTSLILTILSVIITIWTVVGFFQGLQSTYNIYNTLGI